MLAPATKRRRRFTVHSSPRKLEGSGVTIVSGRWIAIFIWLRDFGPRITMTAPKQGQSLTVKEASMPSPLRYDLKSLITMPPNNAIFVFFWE